MGYSFEFGSILGFLPVLGKGILVTLQLTLTGALLGILLGIACAWARTEGPAPLRAVVTGYVEVIRNTPFMAQLFFIFFGLPSAGIRLGEIEGASIAMVVNLGAYGSEIVRAGILATPRGQFEAGASLGMGRLQVFRHVVLAPALERIWPALSSQVVIVMLGSAVVSQIAAEDLTFAANFIQSRNFRPFEIYLVTTLVYLGLAVALRQALRGVGWWIFPRRARR
jgi:polar amino acid transport system permease protein